MKMDARLKAPQARLAVSSATARDVITTALRAFGVGDYFHAWESRLQPENPPKGSTPPDIKRRARSNYMRGFVPKSKRSPALC